jgi:hypothetical protein
MIIFPSARTAVMNTQRLIYSNNSGHNDALVNAILAKSSREHDTREMVRLVDKSRCSRQHNAVVIAVMALNEHNTLCKLMNENRNANASPRKRESQ